MIALPALNYRIIGLFLLVVFCFGAGWKVNGWRFTAKIETMQSDHSKALAKQAQEARTKEQEMQSIADGIRKKQNETINAINSRLTTALNELRDRKPRPSSNTVPTSSIFGPATEGCTGAELYGPDAEFLIREAARADTLRKAYEQCYSQYNQVRDLIGN